MKRKIKIDNYDVCYKIRINKKSNYLQLAFINKILEVVVPLNFPLHKVEDFIISKSEWIKDKLISKAIVNDNVVKIGDKEIPLLIKINARLKKYQMCYSSIKGLIVSLPYNCPKDRIEEFISLHKNWILKRIENPPKSLDGYFLFGNPLAVIREYDFFLTKHKIRFANNKLLITSPEGNNENTEMLYQIWLRHFAKNYLTKRTLEIARQNKFSVTKISVRGQISRWGSCTAQGNISLNFKLMKLSKELIDSVIVHELCHIKHLNHSKYFWKEVESILPNYKELKKELQSYSNL